MALPDGWMPEWDDVPFSLECWECQDCASGDGVGSPEEAVALGWTQIERVHHSPLSNFAGLCPEHSAAERTES